MIFTLRRLAPRELHTTNQATYRNPTTFVSLRIHRQTATMIQYGTMMVESNLMDFSDGLRFLGLRRTADPLGGSRRCGFWVMRELC